jgi:hypothetical protein
MMWRQALDNTIFFQLENFQHKDFSEDGGHVPLHRQFHGVVRSTAAHLRSAYPERLGR